MTRPIRVPFGKYRGWLLTELPADYLRWLGNLSDLREPLRGAVWIEIRDRRAAGKWPAVAPRLPGRAAAAPRPEREPRRESAPQRRRVTERPVADGLARVVEAESATPRPDPAADEWAAVMASLGPVSKES